MKAIVALAVAAGIIAVAVTPASAQVDERHAQREWFSFSQDGRRCVQSESPAAYLIKLRREGRRPFTEDFGGAPEDPALVIVRAGFQCGADRDFYRSRERCEMRLPAAQSIPDRYR